jgi:hypothetical protein
MGAKKVTIRTLPDGSKVYHHPPDRLHLDGKQVLIRERSPLRDRLNHRLPFDRARHAELKAKHKNKVVAKRQRALSRGMPPEKIHV